MEEELQRRVSALEDDFARLNSVVKHESRVNHQQQEMIARHINSVSRQQKRSDLPAVFMAGTFLTFMVSLASLEIGADGVSFSPRETVTTLIAIPGVIGGISALLLPLIQIGLKKYNIEQGNIASLPTDAQKSISD